eukprot:2885622-Rhodomonas_salina.2
MMVAGGSPLLAQAQAQSSHRDRCALRLSAAGGRSDHHGMPVIPPACHWHGLAGGPANSLRNLNAA